MPKYPKREVTLVDDSGVEWIRAYLSEPATKRFIKEYLKFNIWLKEVAA